MKGTMRTLFTAVPVFGHLLPLLPIARAARAAGDEVLVVADPLLGSAVGDLDLVPLAGSAPELFAETTRRFGSDGTDVSDLTAMAGFFAVSRPALSYKNLLATARSYRPDVLVADHYDLVAPLVASATGARWVPVTISPPLSAAGVEALRSGLCGAFGEHGLQAVDSACRLDIWPRALVEPGTPADPDTIPVRPGVHTGHAGAPLALPERGPRARVLVTFGTVVQDAALLERIVVDLLDRGFSVVATGAAELVDAHLGGPGARFLGVGFVPLDQLLPEVDVVVSAGGAGTVLACLVQGVPLVVMPVLADQPFIAAAVAAVGVGRTCATADEVAGAVEGVVDEPAATTRAQEFAARLAEVDDAAAVWPKVAAAVRGH